MENSEGGKLQQWMEEKKRTYENHPLFVRIATESYKINRDIQITLKNVYRKKY